MKRLAKPCKKCGKNFTPTGKYCRYCDDCKKQGTYIRKLVKLQKKVNEAKNENT